MSRFPTGFYVIRPIDAPEGSLTVPPTIVGPPFEVPVRVDKGGQVWEVTNGRNDTFNLTVAFIKTAHRYKWINRDNVLFATLFGSADDFRIESAGPGVWVIGIPNQDLLLTYEADGQLRFKPADGSSAQRFTFLRRFSERLTS